MINLIFDVYQSLLRTKKKSRTVQTNEKARINTTYLLIVHYQDRKKNRVNIQYVEIMTAKNAFDNISIYYIIRLTTIRFVITRKIHHI